MVGETPAERATDAHYEISSVLNLLHMLNINRMQSFGKLSDTSQTQKKLVTPLFGITSYIITLRNQRDYLFNSSTLALAAFNFLGILLREYKSTRLLQTSLAEASIAIAFSYGTMASFSILRAI